MQPHLKKFEEDPDWFVHEAPMFYAAEALISPAMKSKFSPLMIKNFCSTVAGKTNREERMWIDNDAYDWSKVRALVQQILQEYVSSANNS